MYQRTLKGSAPFIRFYVMTSFPYDVTDDIIHLWALLLTSVKFGWILKKKLRKSPPPHHHQPVDPTCASGRRSLIAVGEPSDRFVQFLLLQPAEGSIQWWHQHKILLKFYQKLHEIERIRTPFRSVNGIAYEKWKMTVQYQCKRTRQMCENICW